MLIQSLTEHFHQHFAQYSHHDIVLWFDPQREYEPLLDHLTAYPVWRYAGSLLRLHYQLLQREAGQRVILYLPLKETEVEPLRPFFPASYRFSESLYRFLRQQGFDFPDDPDVAHELRRLLPRLAARSLGKGRVFWTYNLANLERARETLLGNFDHTLLRFLAQPAEVLDGLRAEQLEGLFFAQLESAFGLAAGAAGAGAEDDAASIAARLTAQLLLTQAYSDAGQPADFPYLARLPEPLYYERNRAFLALWQRDTRYGPVFVQCAAAQARAYDLTRWARALPLAQGLQLGATFAEVEQVLWEQAQAELRAALDEPAARVWLAEHRAAFAARAEGFWAGQGRAPWWAILVRAADLLATAHTIRAALDDVSTPGALLARYTAEWWRVDHDYRVLREQADAQATDYELLRQHCDHAYRDGLRRLNARFSTLLEGSAWPPDSELPPQAGFWAAVAGARRDQQRIAVLFVDALRYELGQALLAALEAEQAGQRRTLTARLAAIPTITPIGMSAVLPQGDQCRIAYSDDWQITIADSQNLKDKAARKRWLAQQLPDVAFYNLDELLNARAGEIAAAPVTVIFDTTLDYVGGAAQRLSWGIFGGLLHTVKKGVHKLLGLGIRQIHIIADHGFLLLDELAEHEKASVQEAAVRARSDRYALSAYAAHTDQLAFTIPGSAGLRAWFPRGIGCFRTPGAYNFVHGGLSLQELVIPHLVIEQGAQGKPVMVAVEFPEVIHNAQPRVTLRPVTADMFDQPRQVTIVLEKDGAPVAPPLSQVVRPTEPAIVDFFLLFGCGLEPGDSVRWVLRDAHTDEVLAEQSAVNQANLW